MANLAFDPNKTEEQGTTTDVLNPAYNADSSGGGTAAPTSPSSGGTPAPYVSNGNPYPQNNGATQSARQTGNTNPSSGQHTNVQTYADKNQQSSQNMGQAVENKLQTTADKVRQSTQNVNKQFQQGVEAGSLENWQTAGEEANKAFQGAASQEAASSKWVSNDAKMYDPTKVAQEGKDPTYTAEDQKLVDSNMARVLYGDGTTKDFSDQLDATNSIAEWNRLNPGYNQVDPEQDLGVSDQRLKDILNAKYTGPTDLFQTRGYSDLSNEVREAQVLQDQGAGSGFKGELLKQTFQSPNSQYNMGSQKLDDLLLGQGAVGQSLKDKANTLGEGSSGLLSDDFQTNVQDQRMSALERNKNIENVRTSTRSDLDKTALTRESEINERMAGVVENWDSYPKHYKDLVTKQLDTFEQGKVKGIADLDKKKADVSRMSSSQVDAELKKAGLRPAYSYSMGGPWRERQKQLQNHYESQKKAIRDKPLDLNLSAMESEMLGIKGGEGLYNLLKQKGGVDELFKTAQSDKNKLISKDEQSQLSRLQGIAQLADDYGSQGSGINFENEYVNRDLAGTQSAMDALDMDNLTRKLQGAEKDFRDYSDKTNIKGSGYGSASSSGWFSDTHRDATRHVQQNLGKSLKDANAVRNMYNDTGVNQDNINKILGLANTMKSGEQSKGHTGLNASGWLQDGMGLSEDFADMFGGQGLIRANSVPLQVASKVGEGYTNLVRDIAGNSVVGDVLSLPGKYVSGIGNLGQKIGSSVSGAFFGNSSGLQAQADAEAQRNAERDYQNKLKDTLLKQGYSNQISVKGNEERDMELLKLLGMLDTTNKVRK